MNFDQRISVADVRVRSSQSESRAELRTVTAKCADVRPARSPERLPVGRPVPFIGDLARYDSSDRGWRGSRCASSICFGYKPRPERIYAALGIFDTPDAFPAGFHDNRQSSIAWLRLDEHLPDAADFKPQPRRG